MILNGIKLVELANVLAGPSAGSFFAELGAEVIKIESARGNGDVTRSWKLSEEDRTSNVSAYFSSANYRKAYIQYDLTVDSDHQKVMELVRDADIVIASYKPGDDVKLRVDYDTFRTINPRLIYASIAGFSPNSKRVAYDVVIQAESGFMSMNGSPDGGPVKMPVALMDLLAAHQLKEAILTALYHREKTGKGSHMTVSLYKSAISALANQASNYLMAGRVAQRMGSLHPNIAPYGETFSCKDDKEIVLAIGSEKQFKTLCKVLECSHVSENPMFNSNNARLKNRPELYEALQNYFLNFNRRELAEKLIEKSIPAGSIMSLDEVFESPLASDMIREEEIEDIQTRRVSQIAFEGTYL